MAEEALESRSLERGRQRKAGLDPAPEVISATVVFRTEATAE
jgi:hypothetical protein